MKQQIIQKWEIHTESGLNINAKVPGDITADLFRAEKIADPLWGMNHKGLHWVIESDFTYRTEFDVADDVYEQEEIILSFDGIDTFSEIYLNGQFLGSTDNMFLKYEYSVKGIMKRENNILEVKMLSTMQKMNEIDTTDHFGIFNIPRLFIRKVQCHFGWDWAPNLPGYGIYKPVSISGLSKDRISDITYKAYNDGNISIFTEVNYDVIPLRDYFGKVIEEIPEERTNDKLIYRVATEPNVPLAEENQEIYEQHVSGRKNFANFKIDQPKLWWPAGYGEQPLYEYSVELVRDGKVLDTKKGKFAFREVRLEQKPIATEKLECKFVVNDVPVFAKGSNWVPAECFVGEMKEEKYHRLLLLAKEGNMNMLRVWGGGFYENDVFYELCDELGIMVWQDMMFSCADIPEDRPEFIENIKKEIDYQIRRLRNHPSIIVWSGMNEKVGSLCKQKSHGDYFLKVLLRGLILNLDDTRPMIEQSPFSKHEIASDLRSGDGHVSAFEAALHQGIDKYRDLVSNSTASFQSECAVMGPSVAESYRKIFPADKVWPMNEYWDDRLMDNPYAEVIMTFAERQRRYASELYGESTTLEAFVCKGMTAHAEVMRAEVEYARANKGITWGILNWMYSDSWPSGNWSVVDYYCEPKQAYYQMRHSFEPVLLTFVQKQNDKTYLCIVNDSTEKIDGDIEYGLKTLQGDICWSHREQVSVSENQVTAIEITDDFKQPNTYLYAKGVLNDKEVTNVYSYNMWKDYEFQSDYTYVVEKQNGRLLVTIKANVFAKGITLRLPNNERYLYSDNYFDLEAGTEKTIVIEGTDGVEINQLVVTDFYKEAQKEK